MDSLVDQFAAAGKFRIGAPFLFVADAAAVAVARTDEHQLPQHAGVENLPRLEESRMIAMIEARRER